MELIGIIGALVGLAAAALRWGQDSRPEFAAPRRAADGGPR